MKTLPLKPAYLAIVWFAILVLLTLGSYLAGLNGPFVFDDSQHITDNQQVHIQDLSLPSLAQAWDSSFAPRPFHRPVSQLTFGINHVFSGLDPYGFKATNLAIHLLMGALVFLFSRELARAWRAGRPASPDQPRDQRRILLFSLAVATLWLLHPLHVSTVLYPVQRMTQLSALLLLLALWLYLHARMRMAEGRSGVGLVLLSVLSCGLAMLAKENAVLYPLFLLVLEITLLGALKPADPGKLRIVWFLLIALPLTAGLLYLLTHPGLFAYRYRSFSLEERLLTEFRVLWHYVGLILVPDIQRMGLQHDHIALSRGLLDPASTLIALITWALVAFGAVWQRRRLPLVSFSVLFFIAGHSLESSILPLEIAFEHRNYLPSLGLLILPAGLLTLVNWKRVSPGFPPILLLVLGLFLAALTHARSIDWSDADLFTLTEVTHHPESPRNNFKAAQMAMSRLQDPRLRGTAYGVARGHFEKILDIDADNPDALFGLIILNLHVGRPPEDPWVDRLVRELQNGIIDPTRFNSGQFSFLVKWHLGGNPPLSPATMHRLFDAILSNNRLVREGRAGIYAARSAYELDVLDRPEEALAYRKQALRYWPTRWFYRKRYAQQLMDLGRPDEAQQVLQKGIELGLNQTQLEEARQLLAQASNPVEAEAGTE